MDKETVLDSVKKQISMNKPVLFVDVKAWPEYKAEALACLTDEYMALDPAVNTPSIVVFARKKVLDAKSGTK